MRYLKYLFFIFIFMFFLSPLNVFALTNSSITYYSNNSQTGTFSGDTFVSVPITADYINFRFTSDLSYNSFNQIRLNISNTTQNISPTYSNCSLYVNGNFISDSSISSARLNYECSNNSCLSNYAISISYQNYYSGNAIPISIGCSVTRTGFTRTSFGGNINSATNTDYTQTIVNGVNDIISNNNSAINDLKDSNINKFNDVINGINQQTQNIINNQNENTDKEIESQQVCTKYDSKINGFTGTLTTTGILDTANTWGVTSDFISINSNSVFRVLNINTSTLTNYCFYNINKSYISCSNTSINSNGEQLIIPSNSSFVRFTISKNSNLPTFELCKNGNQAISDDIKENNGILGNIKSKLDDLYNFFTDDVLGLDDIDDVLDDFTSNVEDNEIVSFTHSILYSPVNAINSLKNANYCNSISVSMFNRSISIPSGCILWERSDVSTARDIWNLIFGGFLIYKFSYRLVKCISDSLDPHKDEIGGLAV